MGRHKKVCVLTGGGDAPGLNAVLRAFVRAGVSRGLDILGSEDGLEGLIHPEQKLRPFTLKDVDGILPRGGSVLGCSNRANPFAYPEKKASGEVVYRDVSQQVLQTVRDNHIDVVVAIGGDGTMTHACRLHKMGVPFVGVPKTIDNDLAATDVTFGYDTAVQTATWAIDTLHTTAESHDRVMIVETMGRDAGWIALAAGISGGAHAVLIPEIPYHTSRIVDLIRKRAEDNKTYSIIVIGEGAFPSGGEQSKVEAATKGHLARLGGAGQTLADELHGKIEHEIRVTVLGHLLRGGSPTAFDRLLATRFGVKAAELCVEGTVGQMVSLRNQQIVTVPLNVALEQSRLVTASGELVTVAREVGIELGN